jgi:hypothetical protein
MTGATQEEPCGTVYFSDGSRARFEDVILAYAMRQRVMAESSRAESLAGALERDREELERERVRLGIKRESLASVYLRSHRER